MPLEEKVCAPRTGTENASRNLCILGLLHTAIDMEVAQGKAILAQVRMKMADFCAGCFTGISHSVGIIILGSCDISCGKKILVRQKEKNSTQTPMHFFSL